MFLRTFLNVSLKLCLRLKSMKMGLETIASQEITIVKWHFIKSFNFIEQKQTVKDKLKSTIITLRPQN